MAFWPQKNFPHAVVFINKDNNKPDKTCIILYAVNVIIATIKQGFESLEKILNFSESTNAEWHSVTFRYLCWGKGRSCRSPDSYLSVSCDIFLFLRGFSLWNWTFKSVQVTEDRARVRDARTRATGKSTFPSAYFSRAEGAGRKHLSTPSRPSRRFQRVIYK